MKKIICITAILSAVVMLTACCGFVGNEGNPGGIVDNVKILEGKTSYKYTDRDMEEAIQTIKDYFENNFGGCTLIELEYAGDYVSRQEGGWAKKNDTDEIIVFTSSFYVDSSGGDGSLEANYTYENWSWILVRSKGGSWEHADHGML